jgi:hypothetical protein
MGTSHDSRPEEAWGHHRTVGLALLGFGAFGLLLGAVLTGVGVVGEAFLDGPRAMIIGLVTSGVGGWLWLQGR